MNFQTQCTNCGKRYRCGDDRRGSRVRCRICGAAIRIPGRREPHDPWEDDEYDEEPARDLAVDQDLAEIVALIDETLEARRTKAI